MEEIPLHEPMPRYRVKTPEEVTDQEWKLRYKQALCQAKQDLDALVEETSWSIVPAYATARIKVYTCRTSKEWLFKVEGELYCDAHKLVRVHADNHFDTRGMWEVPDVLHVEQKERYLTRAEGHFSLVECRVGPTSWWERFWCKPFYLLGVQRELEFCQEREWCSVFRTCNHRHFSCPADHVNVQALVGLYAKALEPLINTPSVPRCFARLVFKLKPAQSVWSILANRYQTYLAHRLYLYERVAQAHWETLYGEQAQSARDKQRRHQPSAQNGASNASK